MNLQVLIDPLQDEEVLQSTTSGLQQGSGNSYQLVDLDATKNKSNILKRTNFRQEERDVLVALITEYKGDLDRKNSKDTGRWRYSHLTPTETWQLITDKYNSHPGFRQRDPGQLRKCWMNMKARSQFSMTQRRQLGLECHAVRPPSRSFVKARQTVAIRLRNPGNPNTLSSRSYANRKSNLSRVNGSTQGKIKRSRHRIQQGQGYHPDVVQQKRYEVAKSAQGFSNYQLQSGGGTSELQYLQETVQDNRGPTINIQRHPRPVQLHLASGVLPQSSEIQRVSEMRTSPGYLMPDATTRPTDQRSGNIQRDMSASHIQGQHQMMTVAQSLAQSSNRSRPVAMQPPTILSQMEQFSPPMPQRLMSNTVTVGEFLGNTVEMRPGAPRSTYNPHDDAPGFDVSFQHLHGDDNPGVVSVAAERFLPQASTASESPISYNTDSQVRSIESIADLERVLETGGSVISSVTSMNGESRSKQSDPSIDEDLDEIQIIIKTEDVTDEVHEQISPAENVTRRESAESSVTRIERGVEHRITQKESAKPKSSANMSTDASKNVTKNAAIDAQTQTEAVTGCNSDIIQRPGTEKQREPSDHNQSKTQSRDRVVRGVDRVPTLRNQNGDGTVEKDLHYVDDDDVMEEEDNDVRFIAVETANNDPEELCKSSDDVDDHHDQTGDPSHSFELDENPNEHGDWYSLADEERKARVDLLYFEVEKAKEEAGAAKCRRELLEVELETARQQKELTRIKQEVEIELIREKVRQEKAKADSMIVQTKETHLSEPNDKK